MIARSILRTLSGLVLGCLPIGAAIAVRRGGLWLALLLPIALLLATYAVRRSFQAGPPPARGGARGAD